jgi:hypothetical protein
MNFLAPLFLLGAAAVALPVLFHLIRRSPRVRQAFSSLMFLTPSPPRLVKRSRLEHLLLLILRCAALCLLALGFARPFLKSGQPSAQAQAPGRRLLILLDTSASMRRETLWNEARQKAGAILSKTGASDQAAVYTFDSQSHAVMTFDQWKTAGAASRISLAIQRLSSVSPGWGATHLGEALAAAADTLENEDTAASARAGQIIVISDMQSGSRLEPLQSHHWPKKVQVVFDPVRARNPDNASIQIASNNADLGSAPDDGAVRIKVSNASDARCEQFQVGWANKAGTGFIGPGKAIYVPPGQSRVVPLPAPPDNADFGSVLLLGDGQDYDNTACWVKPGVRQASILFLSNDREGDRTQPYYFLKRAFQKTRVQSVTVALQKPGETAGGRTGGAGLPQTGGMEQPLSPDFGSKTLTENHPVPALIIVADALPEAQSAAIRQQLLAGQSALLVASSAAMGQTLARLAGVDSIPLEEATPDQFAILGEIDFRHPLFAPFADPRFSDFTHIHYWKYRRIPTNAIAGVRSLARFDNGDPAILEAPVGRGRLYVFASNWHSGDSQLALSTKFVPLLYSLLDLSGGSSAIQTQFESGQSVPVDITASAAGSQGAASVIKPDGTQAQLAQGEARFTQTAQPGIYQMTQPPARFAVNLAPSESRTAPLAVEDLEHIGVPVQIPKETDMQSAKKEAPVLSSELESRQKLWQWLLLATLAAVLAESWLAGRLSDRSSTLIKPTL